MPRVILKGPERCQWNIRNRFESAHTVVYLNDDEVKEYEHLIESYVDPVRVDHAPLRVNSEVVGVVDNSVKKSFTPEQLKAMTKAEQIEILKQRDITVYKYPKEEDRIKVILETQ